jgi:hypothetical protein
VCDQLNLNIFRGVDKPPRATDHDHRERQAVCEAADRGIYE